MIRALKFRSRAAFVLAILIAFAPQFAAAADSVATQKTAAAQTSAAVESTSGASSRKERNPRVLIITAKDSAHCTSELARLNRPGGDFAKMRAAGWTIGTSTQDMIQIIDRDEMPDLIAKLDHQEFPTVACVDHGEVVRYFRSGCTTPLDMWTFGFMAKGVDERPKGAVLEAARVESSGSYPLRGNHWSVEGDWNPTRDKVITHLRGPNHLAQLEPQWHIDDWSLEELRSLHDDLHERYDAPVFSNSRSSGSSPATDYLKFKGHS